MPALGEIAALLLLIPRLLLSLVLLLLLVLCADAIVVLGGRGGLTLRGLDEDTRGDVAAVLTLDEQPLLRSCSIISISACFMKHDMWM